MENVIFNNQTYMETYIKQNVGKEKSNPVFYKTYINELDSFFPSWDTTFDGSGKPPTTNPNCKVGNYDISSGGIIVDDELVMIPYARTNILNSQFKINLKDFKFSIVPNVARVNFYGLFGGIYVHKINKIIGKPYRNSYITSQGITLVENTSYSYQSTITDLTYTHGTTGERLNYTHFAYKGGCYDKTNNIIWFTPHNHTVASHGVGAVNFHYYNLTTNDVSHIVVTEEIANHFTDGSYQDSICVDNKIYFLPKDAINTKTDLYYMDITNPLSPVFKTYSNITDGVSNVGKLHEYWGGILYDKKIYLIPSRISNSYKYSHYIDTVTNTIYKMDIPSEITFELSSGSYINYMNGCLAPDGYIYIAPALRFSFGTNPYIPRINVITNTFESLRIYNNEYFRYTSSGNKNVMAQPLYYFSGCEYCDGKVYFIPNSRSVEAGFCDYPFLAYLDLNLNENCNQNIKKV